MNRKLVTGLLIANLIANQIPIIAQVTPETQEKDTSNIVFINKDNKISQKPSILEQSPIKDVKSNLISKMEATSRINYDASNPASSPTIVDLGECGAQGNNLTWILDSDGTLRITGTGDMADYNTLTAFTDAPWATWYNSNSITSIVIGEGVTSIGDNAFNGCGPSLTSINALSNVTSIGDNAFSGCSTLTSIDLPKVKTIGKHAFEMCPNLTDITSL